LSLGFVGALAASEAFHRGAITALAERGIVRASCEGFLQQLAVEAETAKAHVKPQQSSYGKPRNAQAIAVGTIRNFVRR
jgi:hypothetical protein